MMKLSHIFPIYKNDELSHIFLIYQIDETNTVYSFILEPAFH
jgi:hypothetical protein